MVEVTNKLTTEVFIFPYIFQYMQLVCEEVDHEDVYFVIGVINYSLFLHLLV